MLQSVNHVELYDLKGNRKDANREEKLMKYIENNNNMKK